METAKKISIPSIVIFSLLFILTLGVFANCYIYIIKSHYSSYEDNLNVYIKEINMANSSTGDFMKNGVINASIARYNIPKVISTLQKSKDKILVLKPTDKFIFYQTCLIQGLTDNINIYTELLNILNNQNTIDISASRDSVKSFKESCITYYSQVLIENFEIGLQKNTIDFIDSSIYYLDQMVKIKKNQSISDSQVSDFIKGIDETFKNFQLIKTDFKVDLYKLRNNDTNYDNLINLVLKNKSDLTNLKIDFAKISIPQKSIYSNPIIIFDKLKNTMNDYNLYLDSFIYALMNEKVQAYEKSFPKNISDKLYTESDIKISTVIKDYNDFIETYNGFKDIK